MGFFKILFGTLRYATRLFCRCQVPSSERSAAPGKKERTRLPLRHGAGEAAVQRTGGRTHPSDDKPDALLEWSRLAEERQNELQEDTTRRQCHRIRQEQ